MEVLFKLSRMHTIENIVYEKIRGTVSESRGAMRLFEEYYNHAITIDAIQQYYLEMIIGAFEKSGIKHCVMKGPVIKKLYPTSDLRQSGDLDIYVDDEDTEKARRIMEELGFETTNFNKANSHDEYRIDRAVEVEIHRELISNKCPWQKECQKITDRLIREEGHKYRYLMTDEDYYLYMIAHMAKHMHYSGIGIKLVLDVWVYLRKYENKLDWNILAERLKDCGLYEFEENIRKLCGYWFEDKEVDNKIKRLGDYIGASGNFGTYEQLTAGEIARNAGVTFNKDIGKLVYYVKVFFWPYKNMKERYPILKALPILLPACWVHRAVTSILFKKEHSRAIRERYDKVDMDYGKKIIEFKKEIGL